MVNTIMVSVACITYNQDKTVKKMLDSILKQKTNFKFEVIIHDDASTDETPNIIKEYANKYPDIVVPIFEEDNQYSKGKKILISYVYPVVRGKYIAYCEGDDFWTDENKLQTQFDALEKNPECSFSVHDTQCVDIDGKNLNEEFPGIKISEGVITAKEYLNFEFKKKPWLFQTSSYFVRSSIMQILCNTIPDFVNEYPVGDLPIVLLCLQRGNCFYIKKSMSAYRKNSGGVLTSNRNNLNKEIAYYEKMLQGHRAFKDATNEEFRELIDFTIEYTEIHLYKLKGKYKLIDKEKYRKVRKMLSIKNRLLICSGKIMPYITYYIYSKIIRR